MKKRRRTGPPVAAPRPRRPAPPSRHSSDRFRWIGAGILASAVAATYYNGLHVPFHYDDVGAVIENVSIRKLWPLTDVLFPPNDHVAGRPLLNVSYAINYWLGGLSVAGYHVANTAIHALCAILLFGIVQLTLDRSADSDPAPHAPTLGLVVALIWALHPIQTGTVTYISARSESLMALFYFLALYAGILAARSPRPNRWNAASVAACGLGMACKESMATAPVVMVLYDRAFIFGSFGDALRNRWRLYLGLASTWIILAALLWPAPRASSAGFGVGVDIWTYLLNQTVVITSYLRVSLVPTRLIFAYGEPRLLHLVDVAPYAALVCVLLGLTVWTWFTRPKIGFAGVWFFVNLAPTSSFVPIATEVGAERRMYLPLAGLVTLAVIVGYWFVDRARQSPLARHVRLAGSAVACLTIVMLAALTMRRNVVYASSEELWRSTLQNWPSALAHRNLATSLKLSGKRDEAVAHLRATVDEHPEVRYIIGVELFEMRRFDDSIAELSAFIRGSPASGLLIDAKELLGRCWVAKGVPDRAAEQFADILKAKPDHTVAQLGLADALLAQRLYKEAIPAYERYLKDHPDHAGALTNVGMALSETGDDEAALRALRRAVEVAPDLQGARRTLAAALFGAGDVDGAAVHARQAVALKPDDPVARDLYGRVLLAGGRYREAVEQLERALELDPSRQDVRDELARARRLMPPRPR